MYYSNGLNDNPQFKQIKKKIKPKNLKNTGTYSYNVFNFKSEEKY